jgi:signal transduction histidine kinase
MAVQKYDVRRPTAEGGGFEERHWSPGNSPVFGQHGELAYIIHRVEDVTDFVRLKQQGSEHDRIADDLRTRAGAMEAEIYQRAQEIQTTNRQLRELQAELETRVQERTAELTKANAELRREIEGRQRVEEELRREIADRKRAEEALLRSEEQLRQAQKLEAVGRLAGGVAHDFNNLLSVILSYSDELLCRAGPTAIGRPELEEIRQAGLRASDLTRQMLAFSRQQVLDAKVVDLNEIVRGVGKMLGRVLGEDIELNTVFDSALGRVRADSGQIEQVIMNLVVNARDAMPTGGRLTIATSNATLDDGYARDHAGVTPGDYVMLSVSDTGLGMDKATQARVFEPFFTTKERGKGTGLGLSTVFGIVKQSGGHIWLYSEPGGGTTFRVYLPRIHGDPDAIGRASVGPPRGGSETILLVEDDEQIRRVASVILKRAGYDVLIARNPGEALSVSEHHPTKVHLLLTDVVMPKLNGRQVAERIRAMRPDIRVLFMSGYTGDAILHHGVLNAGVAFLQKPIAPDSLMRKVREVLDANGA